MSLITLPPGQPTTASALSRGSSEPLDILPIATLDQLPSPSLVQTTSSGTPPSGLSALEPVPPVMAKATPSVALYMPSHRGKISMTCTLPLLFPFLYGRKTSVASTAGLESCRVSVPFVWLLCNK